MIVNFAGILFYIDTLHAEQGDNDPTWACIATRRNLPCGSSVSCIEGPTLPEYS